MDFMNSRREYADKLAWQLIGTPYIWGGDDMVQGFDCSGMCIYIAQSLGLFPFNVDTTAKRLFVHYKDCQVDEPYRGCFVFFGNPICHVEFCIDSHYAIGAANGGSHIKTIEDAIKYNAFIQLRPIKRNRKISGVVDPFLRKVVV